MKTTDIVMQVQTLRLAESYFTSAVLFALNELDVFVHLEPGPQTCAELNAKIDGDLETLRALLDAAVALDLLGRDADHRYCASTENLVECLGRPDSESNLVDWLRFLHNLTGPLFDIESVVRRGKPSEKMNFMTDSEDSMIMSAAMEAYARGRGSEFVDHVDLSETRTFLDLGCGRGMYSFAALDRHPDLHATLIDVETPIGFAKNVAEEKKLSDRVEFVIGDFMTYSTDQRYDAVLISNALHVLGATGSTELLKRCYDLLNPNGILIIQAQLMDEERTSPRWASVLNLIMHCVSPEGGNHTLAETCDWLQQSGFSEIQHVPLSVWNVNSCVVGRRAPTSESAEAPTPVLTAH